MSLTVAQATSRYYEQFPSGRHQTGDIWTEIPNNGLLPVPRTSALLITPACDLQNRKTDTFVFVPIVPLAVAVRIPSFLRVFGNEMKQTLRAVFPDLSDVCDFSDASFRKMLIEEIANRNAPTNHKQTIDRLLSWLHFCDEGSQTNDVHLPFLKKKKRLDILERITRNSFSTDIHFFPRQSGKTSYAAISSHSVCLFRYLITFPADLFDIASRSTNESWPQQVQGVGYCQWQAFEKALPIRALRLRHEFLVDAITRLTALFNRIGSDDFTDTCVAKFVDEIV